LQQEEESECDPIQATASQQRILFFLSSEAQYYEGVK